jgi:hypothetical protein
LECPNQPNPVDARLPSSVVALSPHMKRAVPQWSSYNRVIELGTTPTDIIIFSMPITCMNLIPVARIDRLSHRKYGTIELENPISSATCCVISRPSAAIYSKSVLIGASRVPLRAL